MEGSLSKAVFLDRDGVINDGSLYYTYKPEDFYLNNGVLDGLRMLQEAGFLLVVITNQGGVAKGCYSIEDVEKTHAYMLELLLNAGIRIAGVYFCPHHDEVAICACRKPAPGMILDAMSALHIDPKQSFMIGDSKRDIEAAVAAGVKGIKIAKNENIVPYCQQIISMCRSNLHI